MPKSMIDVQSDVEIWKVTHPVDPTTEAFFVADPRRTPEEWSFDNLAAAQAKFDERVENAKTEPPAR